MDIILKSYANNTDKSVELAKYSIMNGTRIISHVDYL